ncbi:MAG TPA: DUF4349 domain-containing protein [Bacillota bacterium]|nr:DUF4349 domain-containing protein [Bacillota bacterium]
MENCKEFREQLSLYIDGMLSQQESLLLEAHIKECKDCREELSMLREMVASCQGLEEKEPPEYLYPMIASSLRRSGKGKWTSSLRSKWLKPGLVSVAAVLLVAVVVKGILPDVTKKMATDMAAPAAEAPMADTYSAAQNREFSLKMMEGAGRSGMAGAGIAGAEMDMSEAEMASDGGTFSVAQAPAAAGDELIAAQHDRKIIKNADISLEVQDFKNQFDAVQRMAEEAGGYVESSRSYVRKHAAAEGEREFMEGEAVIRVPSTEFGGCLDRIAALGKVTNRSTYGSDITLQYMDLETRLKSKQVQQERLIEILSKAERVEDILNIENELSRVRTEIESLGTQLRGWDNLVQYSTIRVFMTEVDPKDTKVSVLKADNIWDRMKRGFIRTTNAIMDMIEMIIVGIGYALPVAILAGIAYLVWRKIRVSKKE